MKTYEVHAGEDIGTTAQNMVSLARETNGKVMAKFNDIELTAYPNSKVDGIVARYHDKISFRYEEWRNSPEGKEAKRRAEEARKVAEAARKEGIKSFSLKDPKCWKETVKNNTDGYGSLGIRYAARWANLMEQKITKGAELEDIAEETGHEADLEGVTGFMYGCAVSILSQVWKHGEQLRRWHNLDTQIGNEGEKANESGGVLNPALLRIG